LRTRQVNLGTNLEEALQYRLSDVDPVAFHKIHSHDLLNTTRHKEMATPKSDDFFRDAPDSVKKIREDWGWVQGMYAKATSGTYMADNIRASSKSMRSTASSVADMGDSFTYMTRQLTTPPAFVERYKETFLDVRRRFKAPIVAFIAGISVLPAVFAGPGKMEKLRVASRNLIIFGGGASVVLYPELVMRAAPTVAKSVDAVQVAVSGRISK
jgi:hypothetical protein